jgi:hypothetical protein
MMEEIEICREEAAGIARRLNLKLTPAGEERLITAILAVHADVLRDYRVPLGKYGPLDAEVKARMERGL